MTINDIWLGEFGNEYHKRNEITEEQLEARTKMWNSIIGSMANFSMCIPTSILEIGAGNGINLLAIKNIYDNMQLKGEFYAIEPNEQARAAIREHKKQIVPYEASCPEINIFPPSSMGLVFTSGVLIHLPKEDLKPTMKAMYDLSNKFIVCIEYFAAERREVKYRGEDDAMWLDDYGSMWLNNFKLRTVSLGFMWKPVSNLDNLTFWIFEKVN